VGIQPFGRRLPGARSLFGAWRNGIQILLELGRSERRSPQDPRDPEPSREQAEDIPVKKAGCGMCGQQRVKAAPEGGPAGGAPGGPGLAQAGIGQGLEEPGALGIQPEPAGAGIQWAGIQETLQIDLA